MANLSENCFIAHVSGITEENRLSLSLNLIQLGETLGMAIATVNRTLQQLRACR
jgi:hypothetical protein